MKVITLKARTGRGLGQPEWTFKNYLIKNDSAEAILMAKRKYSLEFGIELDLIYVDRITS